jgi:hypothetical protein
MCGSDVPQFFVELTRWLTDGKPGGYKRNVVRLL